jgi:hypothetical protein
MTRYFVRLPTMPSADDAHDFVEEKHGEIVQSVLFPSTHPAGKLYGSVEFKPADDTAASD